MSSHPMLPAQAATLLDQAIEAIRPHHASLFWGDRLLTLDKAAAFKADPDFRAAIARCSSRTGENQYKSPDGIAWRLHTLVWAARQAVRLDGDFVECGVYEGDMSFVLTEMVDLRRHGRTLYLYDTFCGFSDRYSSPDDYPGAPQFFAFAQQAYTVDGLYERVQARFRNKDYVRVIRGVVPDALAGTAPETISFLHLDMNAPAPERLALEALYDRVVPGGVILFDDYGWILFDKQKQVADEFMAARGQVILELPTGQGLVMKR